MVYFSDFFNLDPDVVEAYGAFNISLINDLPLFIDPFLIYGSNKPEYRKMHNSILSYLAFLRDKSEQGRITDVEIASWYKFSEIKQNWLGYSVFGNGGSGLGEKFGRAMSNYMHVVFDNVFEETISSSSHLEKAALFQIGVGKDNISDFCCNLIKSYLLMYTQTFAQQYLKKEQTKLCIVEKENFDYEIEQWMPKTFTLPVYGGDYIILTPRDILTKDDNWINSNDLRGDFVGICNSIPNEVLRAQIFSFYQSRLPPPKFVGKGRRRRPKRPSQSELAIAVNETINRFPELIDYFIKKKEQDPDGAKSIADEKVHEVIALFYEHVLSLINLLLENSEFYEVKPASSCEEAMKRVVFLKDVIENKDGYRLFYYKNKPIQREADLQVIFRLTWFSSPFDVNREVNNGRGPADYTVSYGSKDKTLVEFKLASNTKLKMNLQNQTAIYEAASEAQRSIKVILYFDELELARTQQILKELKMEDEPDIVLIDAADNKPSASKAK